MPGFQLHKRNIIGLAIAATAALGLQLWTTNRNSVDQEDIKDAQFQRFLMEQIDDESYEIIGIPDWLLGDESAGGEEYTKNLESAMAAAIDESKRSSVPKTIAPYEIKELIQALDHFSNTIGMVMYDPAADDFLFFHSSRILWGHACPKLLTGFTGFTVMIRETFPDRFQGPGSEEFAIAISSGDFPHISGHCTDSFPQVSPECPGTHAPILVFGSVFQSSEIFSNMMAMPMPNGENLHCFKDFALGQRKRGCQVLQPAHSDILYDNGQRGGYQVFGEELGLEWQNLIPQLVWRGTDFNYLNYVIHSMRGATITQDLVEKLEATEEATKKTALTQGMRETFDNMMPRWKSVILTAESEIEAEEKGTLPWANMKFTGPASASSGSEQYDIFAKYGVEPIGESMSKETLATYKYHIDLGGGGGTTWSGTIQKLAMPGLLFHHRTPTKDYIHDQMKPWIHFIPVASHLGDLKEKVEWAESHPQAAKMIADQGSAMMRSWGTPEGYGEMFDEVFKQPLEMAMDAYQPVSSTHPGSSWKDVMDEEFPYMTKVKACTGKKNNSRGSQGGCRDYGKKRNRHMVP